MATSVNENIRVKLLVNLRDTKICNSIWTENRQPVGKSVMAKPCLPLYVALVL
jgi:hypothetical protein